MKTFLTIFTTWLICSLSYSQTDWELKHIFENNPSSNKNYLNVLSTTDILITPSLTYEEEHHYVKKSTDGGETWTTHPIHPTMTGTILHETQFIDENNGFVVGGTSFGTWNVLCKTVDGGQTWEQIDTSGTPANSIEITDLNFISPQIGYIVMQWGNYLYRTTNGGDSFTHIPVLEDNAVLTEVYFIDPYIGFVVRRMSTDNNSDIFEILKTTDGGNTWTNTHQTTSESNNDWYKKCKIQFVNQYQGFAIIKNGELHITQDTGATWSQLPLPLSDTQATDMYFVNNATGYIALDGNIYRTNDAGESWSLQTIENDYSDIDYIQFANDHIGYALNNEYIVNENLVALLHTDQMPATPLSNEKIDLEEWKIYPNPAQEHITIESNEHQKIKYIHLLDVNGKIIKTVTENFEKVNISNLSSGNYILYIKTENHNVSKKIIKL